MRLPSTSVLLLIGLVGCVATTPTERSTGVPTGAGWADSASRTSARSPQSPSVNLGRPVATPALSAKTQTSRVRVAVAPIGTVPFDGLVLPVVAPDGRTLATQVGDAPVWSSLLAAPGSPVPLRTRIEIYDIGSRPPRLIGQSRSLPPGLILTGATDEMGVYVEAPQTDGSRWIGRVRWRDASLDWISRGGGIECDVTVSLCHDAIAWSVREFAGDLARLNIRTGLANMSAADSGASFRYPLVYPDGDTIVVYALREQGIELIAMLASRLRPDVSIGVARRASLAIASEPDPFLAYQAARSVQPLPAVCHDSIAIESLPGVLFYHPIAGRVCIFDIGGGRMHALADRSIAACWHKDVEGWGVFLTTPEGLEHQRVRRRADGWEVTPPVRVLGDSYVARMTASSERPYVLIGPSKNRRGVIDDTKLTISVMRVVADSATP